MIHHQVDTWTDAIKGDPTRSVILVDFDGTLTPIVANPDQARLLPDTVALLHRLSLKIGALAVVSGRPAHFLADRLDLHHANSSQLRAFGRAGLDAVDPTGNITTNHAFDQWLPIMDGLAREARTAAPHALIEEKGVVLTFHWRRSPVDEATLRDMAAVFCARESLTARDGKMSVELFPQGAPTKATVVLDFADRARVLTYIGDDIGDLDAFDAIDQRADHLIGFRGCVTDGETPPELLRRADILLSSPTETVMLLTALDSALR